MGQVRLEVPEGWTEPEPVRFEMPEAAGRGGGVRCRSRPPRTSRVAHYRLSAVAELGSGLDLRSAYPLIDYPHIRPTPCPEPATVDVAAADIRLPELKAVGFVRGASDRVPAALAAIGAARRGAHGPDVEMAGRGADALRRRGGGQPGVRDRPGLGRANGRGCWTTPRRGGLVLVLYQQYDVRPTAATRLIPWRSPGPTTG